MVIFWATWEFLVTGGGRPPIFQRGRHPDNNIIAIKFRCAPALGRETRAPAFALMLHVDAVRDGTG